ncbi:SET and MYND domain-containing protein 4 [Plutella xylostella]|uniref:SET and MYND domain-containing protein 4 n=1 Tax=Plutella xylostella TaxID=51655 RepID=UPI0020331A1C|nr:SET and MYND domain-containing protein 4 [Plutella xylostella]
MDILESIHSHLRHRNLDQAVYDAMKSNDLSDVVMKVYDTMKKNNLLPATCKEMKSECQSNEFRKQGNKNLAESEYQKALMFYNVALLYAPNNSRAMKLAYGNRSALLYKFELFTACLKDLEIVFSLGCPDDIAAKLKKRQTACNERRWGEMLTESVFSSAHADEFFEFNVTRNPQIPCASRAVGVKVEDDIPRVVAATAIGVGTVVAVEPAFASASHKGNHFFSCHYCHKMALNLIPCPQCCYALFCGTECLNKCMQDYHNIECHFAGKLKDCFRMCDLATKGALKIWNLSKTWDNFILESKNTGIGRIQSSSINEVFDCKNKGSLLCFDEENFLVYGKMFNLSIGCAAILHHLASVPSFLPKGRSSSQEALRALARTMMGLCLFVPHSRMLQAVQNGEKSTLGTHIVPNYGLFSFSGKLKNSCDPNLLAVGLDNKLALVAIKPIQPGTELTVSYISHWTETHSDDRACSLFAEFSVACNCTVCEENWDTDFLLGNDILTDEQAMCYRKLKVRQIQKEISLPSNTPKYEKKIFNALSVLSDSPNCEAYYDVFCLFKRCMLHYQLAYSRNVIVGALE